MYVLTLLLLITKEIFRVKFYFHFIRMRIQSRIKEVLSLQLMFINYQLKINNLTIPVCQ